MHCLSAIIKKSIIIFWGGDEWEYFHYIFFYYIYISFFKGSN